MSYQQLAVFLEFSNALLLFVSICAAAILLAYVWRKIRDDLGGLRGIPSFVRYDWLRHRERGAEIGSAFSAVVIGMVISGAALWWWRYVGSEPANFPMFTIGAGRALIILGLVCSIRVCSNERRASRWVLVLLGGVAFGLLTIAI